MKKVYTILCCVLLTAMLGVGIWSLVDRDATFSEREKRALKARPKVTFSGLLDGTYHSQFQDYYADTFPNREGLMAANRTMNGFYYFSGFSSKDSVQLAIGLNGAGANGGEALPQPSGSQQTPSASRNPAATEPTEPLSSGNTDEYADDNRNAAAQQVGAVLLVGNRAMEVPYANHDVIDDYALAVTNIAGALGPGVRTFNIVVPNGAEFYTDEDYHTGNTSQRDMIDYCYAQLGANVIPVHAYEPISRHTEEYIYFRTDHHWTQLGSYYAYTAYCEAAGLRAEPLSRFKTDQYENFVGSMYTFIGDHPESQVLVDHPDTVHVWRPFVDLNTSWYEDGELSMPYEGGTLCYVGDVSNKYLAFLGGDHPVTVIETDVNNGKTVMILKESYGNAFTPWLTSHYSRVIAVDPREFNQQGAPSLDLAAFAAREGVDDCIILNYPLMINNSTYVTWLERLVK